MLSPGHSPMKKIRGDKEAVKRAKKFLTTGSSPAFPSTLSPAIPKHFSVIGPPGKPPASLQKVSMISIWTVIGAQTLHTCVMLSFNVVDASHTIHDPT